MIEALRALIGQPATDPNLEYITASVVLCLTLYGFITMFKVIFRRY